MKSWKVNLVTFKLFIINNYIIFCHYLLAFCRVVAFLSGIPKARSFIITRALLIEYPPAIPKFTPGVYTFRHHREVVPKQS